MMYRVKTLSQSKTLDAEHGVYEVWITREVVDRTQDLVIAAGARIDNFMKNPVVQWAHQYSLPPIAKALDVVVEPGVGVRAKFQFPPFGDSERADEIHKLWRGGFINASSIGFNSIKDEKMNSNDDDGFMFMRPPLKFLEWELMEFSLVPVPANQAALRRSLKYLMTPDQRRREKRRIKERVERSGPIDVPAEPAVQSDSELLLSLSQLSKQLNDLKGVFHGFSNSTATG